MGFKNILVHEKSGCIYALDSDGTLLYSPMYKDNTVRLTYNDFSEVDYDEWLVTTGTRTEYYRIKYHLQLCNAENSIKFTKEV